MADKTRRQFLAALPAAAAVFSSHADPRAQARDVRIDGRRLRERIEKLSVFGRPAGGTWADGVSRTAYSDADLAGRRFVMDEIKAAGLEPRIDPAGNIFARRRGGNGPPILFGSHIDSVPNGGNFDGDLGSLGALAVIEALDAAGVATQHPLEMVVWAHEEGFAFGRGLACSRIVAGLVTTSDMDVTWNGMTRGDAIRKSAAIRNTSSGHAGRKAPTTVISSCTSSRAARSNAPTRPSASSRALSPSTATRR